MRRARSYTACFQSEGLCFEGGLAFLGEANFFLINKEEDGQNEDGKEQEDHEGDIPAGVLDQVAHTSRGERGTEQVAEKPRKTGGGTCHIARGEVEGL